MPHSAKRSLLYIADYVAPTVPTGLTASAVSATQINLSWTASTDNVGVTVYKVYRDGVLIGSPGGAYFIDTRLTSATTYSYTVAACDASANCSAQSTAVTGTTLNVPPPATVIAWGDNTYGQTTVPAGLSGVVAIAGGWTHTVALKNDGTVVAWGDNTYGQTTVPAGLSGVVAIAAGGYYTVALKNDGTVVTWGDNTYGQTAVPAGLSGVGAIAAGFYHTVALKNDGTLVAWGSNASGQTTIPAGLSGVVAIAAGGKNTGALKNDGTVLEWGDNLFGQTAVPAGLSGVAAIAMGRAHSLALKNDGTVVGWGNSTYGAETVPAGLSGVVAIAGGYFHSLALKNDGTVVAWGHPSYGGTVPVGLGGVTAIAAGDFDSLALMTPDTVAPTVPTGLTASAVSATQVNLTWTASTDNVGVTAYKVYRNGVQVGTSAVNSFADTGLTSATTYSYTVAACDAAGNCSAQSSAATATTLADTVAPSVPTGLAATVANATQINLSWAASTDNVAVTAYKVYRDGVQVGTTAATGYTDTGLTALTTYSYTVAACDAAGNCSTQSAAATIAILYYVIDTIDAPTTATELIYSPAYNSLVLKNSASAIATIDLGSKVSTSHPSIWNFTDMSMSPGGRYVFAADYGGENIGYGTPANQHYVHRLDLSTGIWETKTAYIAGNIQAVSDSEFILKSKDQWVTFTNNDWGTGSAVVILNAPNWVYGNPGYYGSVYSGDFRYVPGTGRLLHGDNGLSGQTIQAFNIVNNNFNKMEGVSSFGQGYGTNVALATDGSAFYYGKLQVDPTNVSHNLIVFPEKIYAATRDIAFGNGNFYDAHTGVLLGTLGFNTTVYALNPNGRDFWAYDQSQNKLRHFSPATSGISDVTPPSIPTGLTASAASATQISISWVASTDDVGVTAYKVYRNGVLVGTPVGTSLFDTGLTSATAYSYTVAACDEAGNCSAQSTAVSTTTTPDNLVPSVPTSLIVTAASATQINLTWTASTDNVGVTAYKIYRGGTLLATLGNVTGYSDTGLSAGTTYSYTIAACDAANNCSAQSTAASATTPALDTTPPTIPSSLAASAVSATQINLSWTSSTDNVGVMSYKVYRGGTLLVTLGNVTSYSDTGLTSATPYTYTVAACDAAGNCSAQSTAASATTQASPSGTVVAWGDNTYGETTVPAGLSGVVAIEGGGDGSGWAHTVALKNDGTVVAWGSNNYGQTTVPAGLGGVTSVATGGAYTLALKNDGTVVAWGRNNNGQTTVPAGLSGVTAIVAGTEHAAALRSDSTVVAWGWNAYGQTTVPAGLSGVTAIAAGYAHTVALKSDGTVVAWGNNDYGQTTVPAGLSGVVAIAAGTGHTVALKSDGTVVAWGWNSYGQTNIPAGLSGVVAVAAGHGFTMALKSDGTVVAWGTNYYGETTVPAGLSGVVAIAAGYMHSVALVGTAVDAVSPSVPTALTATSASATQINLSWTASTDNVSVTGYKIYRNGVQVGTSVLTNFSDTGLTSSTTYSYTVAACDAAANCSAQSAAVSATTLADTTPPSLPTGLTASVASATQINLSWAISTDNIGVLGYFVYRDGVQVAFSTLASFSDTGLTAATTYSYTVAACDVAGNCSAQSMAVSVTTPANTIFPSVAAGSNHTVAVRSDGTVVAWGQNSYGQLGDGTATNRSSPVILPGLTGVVAVAAGVSHTVALKSDGTVVAWGSNTFGQLGDGTTTNRSSPAVVPGLTGVVAVAAGLYHAVALKSDGTVVAWGYNNYGQLGDGTTTQRNIPVVVPGLSSVVAVATGAYFTVAIKSDGTVVAWGNNSFGQLGDGTTTTRLSPVVVAGLSGVAAVDTGSYHTVALKSDGTVVAWGYNSSGQLGDGTTTQRNIPVSGARLG